MDRRTGAIVATDQYPDSDAESDARGRGGSYSDGDAEKGEGGLRPNGPERGLSASTAGSGSREETMMALLSNRDNTTPTLQRSGYDIEPFSPPPRQ